MGGVRRLKTFFSVHDQTIGVRRAVECVDGFAGPFAHDGFGLRRVATQIDALPGLVFGGHEALFNGLYGAGEVSFNGHGEYTMGHDPANFSGTGAYDLYEWKDDHVGEAVAEKTDYPLSIVPPIGQVGREWAYAAWSIIIIYSSPVTEGHMLYIDDSFRFTGNDETQIFSVTGFLAPQDVIDDPDAARLTCFVGEGDLSYTGDELIFNGENLSDATNPSNNVWNSRSNVMEGVTIDGIDIDTFSVQYPVIEPGDTSALVKMPTGSDSWNFIYIILSFRSEVTTGGTISYMID